MTKINQKSCFSYITSKSTSFSLDAYFLSVFFLFYFFKWKSFEIVAFYYVAYKKREVSINACVNFFRTMTLQCGTMGWLIFF